MFILDEPNSRGAFHLHGNTGQTKIVLIARMMFSRKGNHLKMAGSDLEKIILIFNLNIKARSS